MTATNRSPARTMKNSIHLPPIDVMNLNDKLALPPTSFNTFEASPVFRSILHDAPDRHRSHHQPARIACQANRVSLSRSVSPQRRSVSMKTSGKRWERTIPENAGPAPEPVRVDYPNTLEVLARFDNKKVNARLMLDYQTRARASKRAGKAQSEADSKFNIGLLHEANCQWSQAIEAFRRYLEICVERHNQQGKAVACNNVAAIYQKMGDLGTALKYHHMHLECADVQGKFVAHTNLGCVYATLDELQTAMEHHQHALRHAIRMESQTSQAIAINNLGITGRF
uniref:Uncharacterized protein n=1 Tax=Spongospora subterranea TaxID=70186 RepID=A0A0H5R128_9EUKA|eukprot:CRZ01499.1 hypothetical protein [Spongospora subterranea]